MISEGAFAEKLQKVLFSRLDEGKLVLPTLPVMAMKVQHALGDPEANIKEIAAILEQDPVLTAQVLKVANSAAFGRLQKIDSIATAISLMGTDTLSSVLYTAVARQVFTSRAREVNETLQLIWNHSLAVALLAQDIAELVGAQNSTEAYLTGLLHDIGQPIVAIYLLEVERSLITKLGRDGWLAPSSWLFVVQKVHPPLGAALAKAWNLPEGLCVAIKGCAELDYDLEERLSLANVVRFANALATSVGIFVGDVDRSEVTAQLMVGRSILGLTEDVADRLASQVNDRLGADSAAK